MSKRNIVGLIIVLIGVGFLLQTTNVIPNFGEYFSTYWPLLIVLGGVLQLTSRSSSKIGGIIIIAIGTLIQLRKLENVIGINFSKYFWPIVIILIGVWFLLSRSSRLEKIDDSNRVDFFALFSGVNTKNTSRQFKGGNGTAIFGGADINLRDAQIPAGQEGVLDLTTAFGGIDIKVPDNWKIVTSGLPLFGGWENKTKNNPSDNAPVLKVRCTAIFGGIEIRN